MKLLAQISSGVYGVLMTVGTISGVSLGHKNEAKEEIIKIQRAEIEYVSKEFKRLRAERDSAFSISDSYKERLRVDIKEIEDFRHVIATLKNGTVDTIYKVDSAVINRIKAEDKKIIDSLKRKTFKDSILLRPKAIGVKPIN